MRNRIAIAIPGIILAIVLVWAGNPYFVAGVVVIGALGVSEYLNLVAGISPIRWAAYIGTALTIALPAIIDPPERAVAVGVGATLVLAAVGGLILKERQEVTLQVACTVLGAIYLGVPLGLFVATRDLSNGAGAIANVLVGTWAFDTFSYFGGKAWGRHPIAPRTSPNKTVEGFLVGAIGGPLAVCFAGVYMDWLNWQESLAIGAIVCAFAYVGDLFESMIKRDIGVKDSGRLLGAHGGVLDRFDAMLFAATAGYFATIWIASPLP